MKEPYIFCWDIQIPTEKGSSVLKWFQRWRTRTSFVVTFKSNWKRQFNIEKIWKITKLYILCGAIQNPTEKDSSLSKWLQRWQNITLFVGTFNVQLKKTVQYWNDYEDDRTLHSLWGHSNSDWKKQFSIEMISKMTEPHILCGDIQIPTEKDSSVFKWFQICRNLTSFVGTFKFQLKRTIQYWNDYKDDRTLHSLWGHSNYDWKNSSVSKWFQRSQNFTSSVATFKFQLKKKQFSIEMISKMTEPCILCGDIHVPTEKSLQHRNDLNYQRTLHPLWGHSNPNWKTQIIIEIITKMTAPYILCWHIQFQLKEAYIFYWDV